MNLNVYLQCGSLKAQNDKQAVERQKLQKHQSMALTASNAGSKSKRSSLNWLFFHKTLAKTCDKILMWCIFRPEKVKNLVAWANFGLVFY